MHSGAVDMISILVNPLLEIVLSLGLGALMGVVLTWLEKLFNSNTNRLNMTIAFVFLQSSAGCCLHRTARNNILP